MSQARPYFDRRRFLTLAGLAAFTLPLRGLAADRDEGEGDEVVILNDTHISGASGAKIPARAADDTAHLRQAVEQIIALPRKPAAVIINGDLALQAGTEEDYKVFRELIAPLREAGLKVHLNLGNHDTRAVFVKCFPDFPSASNLTDHRHNGVIDLPSVRLILLDSLKDTPAAPGALGAEQIAWMLARIDEVADRPVVLIGHHNIALGGDPAHFPGGITDTEAFWPEVVKRPQVKAYVHGHTHEWTLAMHTGIHIVSTLACAYVSNPAIHTTGWTAARFTPRGVELKLRTLDPGHVWNGEKKWFFWRQPKKTR